METAEPAQLYVEAERLKAIVSSREGAGWDPPGWQDHHALQKLYKTLLVNHLAYSLQKKIELDLWNVCVKEPTTLLQKSKNSRPDPKVVLDWFLEWSHGVYAVLLQEIQVTHQARCPDADYIRQHVLVHLGDVARYRNKMTQAEMYYREAMVECPCFGHAYNQMALLEAGKGDPFQAVYYYTRSLALAHPFPVATANLAKTYERVERQQSDKTFTMTFLQFHAHLHRALRLRTKAVRTCIKMNEALTSQVATEALSCNELVCMVAINIFQLDQVQETPSPDEALIRALLLESTAAMLNAFLLPVYTLKAEERMMEYSTLPAAHLVLKWLALHPEVLKESGFRKRMHIWPSLSKFLNAIECQCSSDDESALPEELKVRGFLPLETDSVRIDYSKTADNPAVVRCGRFVALGKMLSAETNLFRLKEGKFEATDNIQCVNFDSEDLLAKCVEETSLKPESSSEDEDNSEGKTLSSQASEPKEKAVKKRSSRFGKNAAMSAIMRKMDQDSMAAGSKTKVSFQLSSSPAEEEKSNQRFIGINGVPPQVRGGTTAQGFHAKGPPVDFSVPPPLPLEHHRPTSGLLDYEGYLTGVGMIGPNHHQYVQARAPPANNYRTQNSGPTDWLPERRESSDFMKQLPIGSQRPSSARAPFPPPPLSPLEYASFSGPRMSASGPDIALQPPRNQHLLFQPGPSTLERFLQEQQNRKNN